MNSSPAPHDDENILPAVSVVIPVRNEERHIRQCLANLLDQRGRFSAYEIIVADGGSTDDTPSILAQVARSDARVRVLANPRSIVSTGLNLAVREARGEVIVRADAHTEYAEDYVERCVRELMRTGADNVGGAARTRALSYFQRVNAAAYHSWFAVGGARFHDSGFEGPVDTVPYGCWWKRRLLELGLFDEDLVRNQDDELNLRITRSGGVIWQSAAIRSWYYPRGTPIALYRQYYQYGYWKVRVIRKHRIPASVRHLVPMAAIVLATMLLLLTPFSRASAVALGALAGIYFLLSVSASLMAARRAKRLALFLALPVAFLLYHAGYGLGFSRGLADIVLKGTSPAATGLTR